MTLKLDDIRTMCQKAANKGYNTKDIIKHVFDDYSQDDSEHNLLIKDVFDYLKSIKYTEMMELIVNKLLALNPHFYIRNSTMSLRIGDFSDIIGKAASYIEVKGESNTVLGWAVKQGHLKTVKFLMNQIPSSEEKYLNLIDNAWLLAVLYQKIDILVFLLPLVPAERISGDRGEVAIKTAMSAESKNINVIMLSVLYTLKLVLDEDRGMNNLILNTPDFLARLIFTPTSLPDIIFSDTEPSVVKYLLSQVPDYRKDEYWCGFISSVLATDAGILARHTGRVLRLLKNMPLSTNLFKIMWKMILVSSYYVVSEDQQILTFILKKMDEEKSGLDEDFYINLKFEFNSESGCQEKTLLMHAFNLTKIKLIKMILERCHHTSREDMKNLLLLLASEKYCAVFSKEEQYGIYQMLANKGGEIINGQSDQGENALIKAIKSHKLWLVEELLDNKNFDKSNKVNKEALFVAVKFANIDALEMLYNKGMVVKGRDCFGKTLLACAILQICSSSSSKQRSRFSAISRFCTIPTYTKINGIYNYYNAVSWDRVRQAKLKIIDCILDEDNTDINATSIIGGDVTLTAWEHVFTLFKTSASKEKLLDVIDKLLTRTDINISFNSRHGYIGDTTAVSILFGFKQKLYKSIFFRDKDYAQKIELIGQLIERGDHLVFNTYLDVVSFANFYRDEGIKQIGQYNCKFDFPAIFDAFKKRKSDGKITPAGLKYLRQFHLRLQKKMTQLWCEKDVKSALQYLCSLDESPNIVDDSIVPKYEKNQALISVPKHQQTFLSVMKDIIPVFLRNALYKNMSGKKMMSKIERSKATMNSKSQPYNNYMTALISFALAYPPSSVYQLLVCAYGIHEIPAINFPVVLFKQIKFSEKSIKEKRRLNLIEDFFSLKMIDWAMIMVLNKEIIRYRCKKIMPNGETFQVTNQLPDFNESIWRHLARFLSYAKIKKLNEQPSPVSNSTLFAEPPTTTTTTQNRHAAKKKISIIQ